MNIGALQSEENIWYFYEINTNENNTCLDPTEQKCINSIFQIDYYTAVLTLKLCLKS